MSDDEIVLPDIVELDLTNALRRVAGNKKLYLKILISFAQNEKDSPAKIRALIDNSNIEEAEQLAHKIKGSAGNLGHTVLHNKLIALDNSLKENKDLVQINLHLNEFEATLSEFIHKLTQQKII
ncbi:MAG: Hpt domain-containing protein [Leptospira sp.]|nr:Hpt domain-containing protein [Leptospira sp.]